MGGRGSPPPGERGQEEGAGGLGECVPDVSARQRAVLPTAVSPSTAILTCSWSVGMTKKRPRGGPAAVADPLTRAADDRLAASDEDQDAAS